MPSAICTGSCTLHAGTVGQKWCFYTQALKFRLVVSKVHHRTNILFGMEGRFMWDPVSLWSLLGEVSFFLYCSLVRKKEKYNQLKRKKGKHHIFMTLMQPTNKIPSNQITGRIDAKINVHLGAFLSKASTIAKPLLPSCNKIQCSWWKREPQNFSLLGGYRCRTEHASCLGPVQPICQQHELTTFFLGLI